MKPRILNTVRLSFPLATALAALLTVHQASAETKTWAAAETGTEDWGTGANWSDATMPDGNDTALFNSTGYIKSIYMGDANRAIGYMTFDASTGETPYTINVVQSSSDATFRQLVLSTNGIISVNAGTHTIKGTGTAQEFRMNGGSSLNVAEDCTLNIDAKLYANSSYLLSKTGLGTVVLKKSSAGASSWVFSLFTVEQGTLEMAVSNAAGNSGNKYSVSSGGTLKLSAAFGVNTLTLNGSGASGVGALYAAATTSVTTPNVILATDSDIGVLSDKTLTITNAISGTGTAGLTKVGAGTLNLNGNNTYTGDTLVNEGDIGGTGTVGGNVTVYAAGNLAPGVTAGTLNITGNLDISAMASDAGTLKFGLDALAGTNDKIVVGGSLALGSLALDDLVVTNLGGLQSGTYTLITSTGLTGTVDGTTALIATGFTGKLQITGNNLELVVTALSTPYETWAGAGVPFDADANNDGVDNGMAWVLGATDKNANAIPLLPTMDNTSDPDFFIFTYRRDDDAFTDPNTTIKAEYGSTLAAWTTAVASGDIIITPTDDGAGTGIDLVQVKIRRTLAVGGKLFGRLNVGNAP